MPDDDDSGVVSRTGELAAGIAGFMIAAVLFVVAVDLISNGALSGLLSGILPAQSPEVDR